MGRAPFQVLVIPYWLREDGSIEYALFRRREREGGYWQPIAGGGENEERPEDAARREALEEAGIPLDAQYIPLSAMAMVPVCQFPGASWGKDVLVIPEYAFGVHAEHSWISISYEHLEYVWARYTVAYQLVKWDSNRTALWELNQRLTTIDD